MPILLHDDGRAAGAVWANEELAIPAANAQHRHAVVRMAERDAQLSAMSQGRCMLTMPRRSAIVQGRGDDITTV